MGDAPSARPLGRAPLDGVGLLHSKLLGTDPCNAPPETAKQTALIRTDHLHGAHSHQPVSAACRRQAAANPNGCTRQSSSTTRGNYPTRPWSPAKQHRMGLLPHSGIHAERAHRPRPSPCPSSRRSATQAPVEHAHGTDPGAGEPGWVPRKTQSGDNSSQARA